MYNPEWTALKKLLFLRAATGSGGLVERTATGNPAVFKASDAKPLIECTAAFLPVQSGTGDPSPSNVRPITGWTGVNVTHCGKNLFDKANATILNAYITSSKITTSSKIKMLVIRVNPSTTYTMQKIVTSRFYVHETSAVNPAVGDSVKHLVSDSTADHLTFTTSSDTANICVTIYNSDSDTMTIQSILDSVQLEVGSTATAYEAYSGATYPVSWTASGTVYGGYVDLVTGQVWRTRATWTKNSSTMNTTMANYPGWFSSGFKAATGLEIDKALTQGDSAVINCGTRVTVNTTGTNDSVYLPKSVYNLTQDEWKALAINIQVCVVLATPVLVTTLTPAQITAF